MNKKYLRLAVYILAVGGAAGWMHFESPSAEIAKAPTSCIATHSCAPITFDGVHSVFGFR